jgi:ribosome biogenesis protein UTP30
MNQDKSKKKKSHNKSFANAKLPKEKAVQEDVVMNHAEEEIEGSESILKKQLTTKLLEEKHEEVKKGLKIDKNQVKKAFLAIQAFKQGPKKGK